MRIGESSERLWCGRIKSDGGKSKTRALSYSPFKSHFRWCFEYRTFLQKIFSMTKIGCFQRGFSLVDFSAEGFLALKDFQDSSPYVPV